MKKKKGDDWFPFWIDKWLLGSTRDELTVEQCAVWVDFLALSYKDDGYIRANEGMPYPIKRLAGLLNRSEELIQQTIDRCLEPQVNKLRLEPDGTLYVISHPEYELSKRHKRRLSEDHVRQNGHDVQKRDAKNREEKSREEKNRIKDKVEQKFEKHLWKPWPQEGRFKKKYCLMKYRALIKAGKEEEFHKTTRGYSAYIQMKEERDNFKQQVMHLSTWLNNWEGEKEQYINLKYEAPL